MAVISTNAFGDLDLQSYAYKWMLDGSAHYAYTFSTDKGNYTFIPDDFIAKGVTSGNKQYYSNSLLNKDLISEFYTKQQPIDFGGFKDFDGADAFYNRLSENKFSTSGVLVPESYFQEKVGSFKNYTLGRSVGNVTTGAIKGIGEKDGQLVYIPESSGADQATAWIQNDGKTYAQWMPKLNFFQRLGREIAKVPLFPELAAVAVAAIPGGQAYAPYVYAALKGAALGSQGVDPLKAGLMVGINLMAQNLASNPAVSKSIGATFGIESEVMQLAAGKAIIGASVNGVRAAIAGQDVTKAMLEGAVTAGASSMAPELTKNLLGGEAKTYIDKIANATNLTTPQIQTIIATSFVSGIASEVNGGDFAKTFTNSLVGAGVSQSVANEVGKQIGDTVSPEMRQAIVTGTSAVARTATTAALNGKDIGKEIEANLPATIVATMTAYTERRENEAKAVKEGWSNYETKVLAQAKYGNDITPQKFGQNEQFIKDVKEFSYDASEASSIDEAKRLASANGYNTFLGPDKKIYTIGGQSLSSMDTFVQAHTPGFDPDAYRKLNNLGSDINAAEHYLDIGQYKNLPVSFESYVNKTFSALPEYDKAFYQEEFDAALNAAKAGDLNRVDEIAKFIDRTYTTNDEAKEYIRQANKAVGIDREPTQRELDMIRGQNEINAYTIAQHVSATGATTFDASQFSNAKQAGDAAKAAGYNTFIAGDGNTYRVMSTLDEANLRANIEDQKSFRDAFAMARAQLGDGKTFTWNGKTYTTNVLPTDTFDASRSSDLGVAATLAYANGKTKFIGPDGKTYNIPDSAKSILENASNQSAAETQRLLRQAVTPEQNEYKAETQRLMESGTRGVMDNVSAMTAQVLGTTARGMAEFLNGAGKTYAAMTGDMNFDNALTKLGSELETYAKSKDVYGLDVQKDRIQQALNRASEKDENGNDRYSFSQKAAIVGGAIKNNPIGFFDVAGTEFVQSAPELAAQIGLAVGTGGTSLAAMGGIYAVSAAGSFVESFGVSAEDAYKQAKSRGDRDEVARDKAYVNGMVSAAIEAGTGVVADKALLAPFLKNTEKTLARSMTGLVSSTAVGSGAEFVSEFGQNVAAQLIVNPTAPVNIANATTAGIYASFIGGAVQVGSSIPGFAMNMNAIIGKDYQNRDVTISDLIEQRLTIDPSKVNTDAVIGVTDKNNVMTLGGMMTLAPRNDFDSTILNTYAPKVFANPNLVVGRDVLGNPVTVSNIEAKVSPDVDYVKAASELINTTADQKKEAQKVYFKDYFKEFGYQPTESQISALVVANPQGNESLDLAAKNYALQKISQEENYQLSEKEAARLSAINSNIQSADDFRTYIDPLAVTREEAVGFFGEQRYTRPTQQELDDLMGRIEADAITRSITIADPYVIDAGEIKAAAAAEGFLITDEEANNLSREANEVEGIAAYRQQIDPLAVIDVEAKQFFDTYGYVPEPSELQQFIASRPETDVLRDIGSYVDPRQMTKEEAEAVFGQFGYQLSPEEVTPFIRQGKDIQEQTIGKEIESYIDPRMVNVQELMDYYRTLGIDVPAPQDVTPYVGQKPEAETLAGLESQADKIRLNAMKYKMEQDAEAARRARLAQQGMALISPEIVADESVSEPLRPFITSQIKQQEFVSPLEQFMKEAKTPDFAQAPFSTPSVEPAPELAENTQQGGIMPSYFTYGEPTDIDRLFSAPTGYAANFNPFGNLMAARGGLATPLMAGGGLPVVHHSGKLRRDYRHGDAVSGPGDGQSDDIPAMLADGEFVFPADVVAALGNGSTKAGSKKLYEMMHSIRAHHRSAKPQDLPPPAKASPLDYLRKGKR